MEVEISKQADGALCQFWCDFCLQTVLAVECLAYNPVIHLKKAERVRPSAGPRSPFTAGNGILDLAKLRKIFSGALPDSLRMILYKLATGSLRSPTRGEIFP